MTPAQMVEAVERLSMAGLWMALYVVLPLLVVVHLVELARRLTRRARR